jgi:hypothetical protein
MFRCIETAYAVIKGFWPAYKANHRFAAGTVVQLSPPSVGKGAKTVIAALAFA